MKTLIFLAISLVFAPLAQGQVIRRTQEIRILGLPSYLPLAEDFGQVITGQDRSFRIVTAEASTDEAAAALIAGRCDVAVMNRIMTPQEYRIAVSRGVYPIFHPVAIDSIMILANPINDAWNVTIDQIQKIWEERIRSWNYLGWENRPVLPVSAPGNTAAHELFGMLAMRNENWPLETQQYLEQKEGSALSKIQVNAGAIGYLSPHVVPNRVKILAVEGIEYTKENIVSGKYPLAAPVYFVTNGYPPFGSSLQRFVTLPLAAPSRNIIEEASLISFIEY